jgi:hypothetical protein
MGKFFRIFSLETKRLFGKRTLGLFVLISLLSLYFVQLGIGQYKAIIESREKFQDLERTKVEQYINYSQYGAYGIRILFIPSPLSIYFANSSVISELTSNVDSGEGLKIYNSFKGKTLFTEKSGGFKDFSGIILLFGSLFVLYLGYESLVYKDYMRFLADFVAPPKLFASILLSRILLFTLVFAFNVGLSLSLLRINDITLSGEAFILLTVYIGVMALMLVFFFVLGSLGASFHSKFAGFAMIVSIWFVFVFLVPGTVNMVTARQAEDIESNYHLELEKLKTLMRFEERARKTAPLSKDWQRSASAVRKVAESYWDNEFSQTQAMEKGLARKVEKNIRFFQRLSSLFPSTLYLSASNEIGSKGYENFIQFFNYVHALKEKFVRYYAFKRFYGSSSKIESFVKGNENVFCARSRLPRYFLMGVMLMAVYIAALGVVSYFRFKRSLKI